MSAVATETTDQIQAFQVLPLDQVVPSPLNTRRHFDAAALEELTESIKTHGVITPLLVRPTDGGKFEIAAGERRYRAAKKAKLEVVPAIVRAMDDVQFLELVTIENLQREDVHPLDEGLGYRRLMTDASYTAEMVAEKVGKSTSYVYQRLKLAELIPPLQKGFLKNELTPSHAILMARLQPKDQERALKEALFRQEWITRTWTGSEDDGGGDRQVRRVASVRELEAWIQQTILLDLHRAPWKKDDATLVPAAGPCTTCPKRTGNQPQLFPDVKKGDTCTDGECYALKMTSFIDRKAEELSADGKRPVVRISTQYRSRQKDILASEAWHEVRSGDQSCASATKGIFVDGSRTGQAITVCADSKCKQHHAFGGGAQQSGAEKARTKREAQRRRLEQAVRQRILDATLAAVPRTLDRRQLTFLATALFNDVGFDDRKQLCVRRKLEPGSKKVYGGNYKDYEAPVLRLIPTLSEAELVRFCLECALVGAASVPTYSMGDRKELLEAAKVFRVNASGIERTVRQELAKKAIAVKERTKKSTPRPRGKVQTSAKAKK